MSTISTGYSNQYPSPSAATSTPANFGPGQLRTNTEQTEGARAKADEVSAASRKSSANTGYTTPTRGNNLNITA